MIDTQNIIVYNICRKIQESIIPLRNERLLKNDLWLLQQYVRKERTPTTAEQYS